MNLDNKCTNSCGNHFFSLFCIKFNSVWVALFRLIEILHRNRIENISIAVCLATAPFQRILLQEMEQEVLGRRNSGLQPRLLWLLAIGCLTGRVTFSDVVINCYF